MHYAFYLSSERTATQGDLQSLQFLSDKLGTFTGEPSQQVVRDRRPWTVFIADSERTKYENLLAVLIENQERIIHYRIVHRTTKEQVWFRDKVVLTRTADDRLLVCGELEQIFNTEETTVTREQISLHEVELMQSISSAANAGAGVTELTNLMLSALAEITGIHSNRFYSYNKEKHRLGLNNQKTTSIPITFLERKFGISIDNFAPILRDNNVYETALQEGSIFITSKPEEILELIKWHTDSKALQKVAEWVQNFLNIRTYGVLPLVVQGQPFGLITFTSNLVLSSVQCSGIESFTSYLCFALSKLKAEQELKEERDFYRQLLDSVPAEIAIFDEHQRILFANTNAFPRIDQKSSVIGRTEREIARQLHLDMTKVDKRTLHFEEAMKRNVTEHWVDEINIRGVKRSMLRSFTPIYNEKGFYRMVAYGMDISSLRETEADKETLIHDLSRRIADQTEYNYIVSHHLRAPVASLMGLTGILDLADDEAERKLMLEHIKDAATELDNVLKDLSTVLNLKSQSNLEVEHFYLDEVCEVIEVHYRKALAELNTTLNMQIDSAIKKKELCTYKSYLENILRTFISNAIVYRASDRQLQIVLKAEDKGDELVVSICDNGKGIDMDLYGDQLFGLYKRFHPDHPGKGLELHIAKNQSEHLNGTIEVCSALNEGSSFSLRLPYRLL
jgi:signal transduction histidine kinase